LVTITIEKGILKLDPQLGFAPAWKLKEVWSLLHNKVLKRRCTLGEVAFAVSGSVPQKLAVSSFVIEVLMRPE
jgi:hypothetical protein